MIRAVLIGASGRMGLAIARASREPAALELRIVGAVASGASGALGRDLGELAGTETLGVAVQSELDAALEQAQVVIDFSHPAALARTLDACRRRRIALLVGTTGLTALQEASLQEAAREIAVLTAANTSLGITVLLELVRRAARALPEEFELEIFEAHHRMKQDAPSGTALALGRAAAEARGQRFEEVAVLARAGAGARRSGEIGFAVSRAGDIVGEHILTFAASGERLVLGHVANDRAIFARGALAAARWLVGQPPGFYGMVDVLDRINRNL